MLARVQTQLAREQENGPLEIGVKIRPAGRLYAYETGYYSSSMIVNADNRILTLDQFSTKLAGSRPYSR